MTRSLCAPRCLRCSATYQKRVSAPRAGLCTSCSEVDRLLAIAWRQRPASPPRRKSIADILIEGLSLAAGPLIIDLNVLTENPAKDGKR